MPLTRAQWDAAAAAFPQSTGFTLIEPRYYNDDTDCDNGSLAYQGRYFEPYCEAIDRIKEWAQEYGVEIYPGSTNRLNLPATRNHRVMVFTALIINPRNDYNPDLLASNAGSECLWDECNGMVGRDGHCTSCDRDNACFHCHRVEMPVQVGMSNTLEGTVPLVRCEVCAGVCQTADCTNFVVFDPSLATTYRSCPEHLEMVECTSCERPMERSRAREIEDNIYCSRCAESLCDDCGSPGGNLRYDEAMGVQRCPDCHAVEEEKRTERFDEDAEITATELMIPSLPNRPTRLISFEQEFMSPRGHDEGHDLSEALHAMGVCWTAGMNGYHAGSHSMPCHVETDASVTGGELIYNRLNLATEEDAQHMVDILGEVRERVRDGSMQFTLNCGGHIHADLHGFVIRDVRNLVTMFNYLEDPIFRMAGAHYEDHRTVVYNDRYSAPIIKGCWQTDREFGVEFLRNSGHADALNLQHYYRAIREHCTCGAMEFGQQSECTCVLPKCTAEWRVFNGTANPRKLHGWIAFVQSLTAWCQDREINPDEYPSFGLNTQARDFHTEPLSSLQRRTMEHWQDRLTWIFQNLTFTDAERESLAYVIRNSVMSILGDEFIDGLLDLERVEDDRVLEAPMVAARDEAPNAGRRGQANTRRTCRGCGEYERDCYCEDGFLPF